MPIINNIDVYKRQLMNFIAALYGVVTMTAMINQNVSRRNAVFYIIIPKQESNLPWILLPYAHKRAFILYKPNAVKSRLFCIIRMIFCIIRMIF